MPYSQLFNVTSSLGSGFDRVRVDQGQTSLFEGREFRSYYEFSADVGTAIAVGGTLNLKFTCSVDFILQNQSLQVDKGGLRLVAYSGGTDGGGWTSVPVVAKNRSTSRRTPYYVGSGAFYFGGTFSGGTEVDVIRNRTASQTVSAINVNASQDSVRYLPAGTYFIQLKPLAGVNDSSEGVYSLSWEERPTNWPATT